MINRKPRPRVIEQRLGVEPKHVGFDTVENIVILAAMGRMVMRLSLSEAYALQDFLESVLPDPSDIIA